jgi:CheY-like chemotaxis protein
MTSDRQSDNRLIVVINEDLSRAQLLRLATLGRLTASVTHDLNNLLTVIRLHSALADSTSAGDEEFTDAMHRIGEAASKGSELLRRVLNFMRGKSDALDAVQLDRVLDEVVALVTPLLGGRCSLEVSASDQPLKPILGNVSGLEQVLMNLILNAADSMAFGGSIRITMDNVSADGPSGQGEFVEVAVIDAGEGMNPDAVESLFRPFHTTKSEGSGLGLSIVQEWVDIHRGTIAVETSPGAGTCFRIRFPVADARKAPASENVSHVQPQLGRAILLVEDDEGIRHLGATFLRKSGWPVHEAASADEALSLWTGHRADIGLLFTDLVLGGAMDGRQLAEALQNECPNLPVIFTSGYYSADGAEEWLSEANFLPKPFHPRKLSEMVRRVHGMASPNPSPSATP